jgi:hypothetical protein
MTSGPAAELDPTLVSSVMVEAGHSAPPGQADVRAIAVSPLDAGILDAVVRLVRLLESPADARVLLPLITREIIYRLLMGEQGGRLRHLALLGATPTALPERWSAPVTSSTSPCASSSSRASWA